MIMSLGFSCSPFLFCGSLVRRKNVLSPPLFVSSPMNHDLMWSVSYWWSSSSWCSQELSFSPLKDKSPLWSSWKEVHDMTCHRFLCCPSCYSIMFLIMILMMHGMISNMFYPSWCLWHDDERRRKVIKESEFRSGNRRTFLYSSPRFTCHLMSGSLFTPPFLL